MDGSGRNSAASSRADLVRAEEGQAGAMMRRVSPEGRAEARRAREQRARRVRALALGWLAIAVVVFLAYAVANLEVGPLGSGSFLAAVAVMLAACALLAWTTRERAPAATIPAETPLPLLGDRMRGWAAARRPGLPAPAAALLDGIADRLDTLAPQLARVPDGSAEADALRRLVAGELPALVDGYGAVPAALRERADDAGPSPDDRLLHGLGTVGDELAALTRRIGATAVDGLSTQDRFLDGKYRAADPFGG